MEDFQKRAMGDFIKEFEGILEDMLKQRFQTIKKVYFSRVEVLVC